MSDKLPVPVTMNQIAGATSMIMGKIRTMITEMHYQYQPGHIGAMMSDLRALQHIQALDASDAGLVVPVKVNDAEVRKAQQAAARAAESAERKRLGAR